MKINFTKMQGLGNDFMVIDATSKKMSLQPEQIIKLADRNFGIGFDQLLLIETSDNPEIDFHYRIFNANGEEVEQCGNGARCLAKFVQHYKLSSKETIVVETVNKTMKLTIDNAEQVTADMGESKVLALQAKLPSTDIIYNHIDMGNPHAVIRVDDVAHAPVNALGPLIQSKFPEGINVGFMQIIDKATMKLRVYERGVGETLACGSGACAAVVAANALELIGDQCQVELSGGNLQVSLANGHVLLAGPAQIVYEGQTEL